MVRRVGLAFLAALALGAGAWFSAQALAQSAPAQVPLIEPATLHAYVQGGIKVTIVDVRQPEEFAQGHIAGARLMPLGDLSTTYTAIPKKGKLVVYCRSGHRSAQAVTFLMQQGFKDIASLHGGYAAWTAAGY